MTIPTARPAWRRDSTAAAPRADACDLTLAELDAAFGPLTLFVVQVKAGARITYELEAMGRSRVAVQKQHECLCGAGEQVIVLTPDEAKERAVAAKAACAAEPTEAQLLEADLLNLRRKQSGAAEREREDFAVDQQLRDFRVAGLV